MRAFIPGVLILAVIATLLLLSGAFYTLGEHEQAIITEFGKPLDHPIVEPGLHFKIPFIQTLIRFEKRWLAWDGSPNQIPTKDKKYIWVDAYARWRIVDPLRFYQSVRDERSAQSRLDDIIDGATRDAVASANLIDVVRTSNQTLISDELSEEAAEPESVTVGREVLSRRILDRAASVTPDYGIALVDVQLKRVNYIDTVQQKVFERMISERQRTAERYRSEGLGKSAEIRGQKERELKRVQSEAYRTSEELKGTADAKATAIYAEAYEQNPELYRFLKTLDVYRSTLDEETTLLLSTDSKLFEFLTERK